MPANSSNNFFTKSAQSSSSDTAKQSIQPQVESLAKLRQLSDYLQTYYQASSDENFAKLLLVYQGYLGLPVLVSADITQEELKKRLINTIHLLWQENHNIILRNIKHMLEFKNLQIKISQKIMKLVQPHISKDTRLLTIFVQTIYLVFRNTAAMVSLQNVKLDNDSSNLNTLRQYLNNYMLVTADRKVAKFLSEQINHKQLIGWMIELFNQPEFKNLTHSEYLYLGKNFYLANTGDLTKSILESSQSCLIKAKRLLPDTTENRKDKDEIQCYLNYIVADLNYLKEEIDSEIRFINKFGYNF